MLVETIAFGFFGGIAGDLLAIRVALKSGKKFTAMRKGFFRGFIACLIDGIIASLVVYAYIHSMNLSINPLLAIQLGASTPLILSNLAKAIPNIKPPKTTDFDVNAVPNAQIGRSEVLMLERLRQHFAIVAD